MHIAILIQSGVAGLTICMSAPAFVVVALGGSLLGLLLAALRRTLQPAAYTSGYSKPMRRLYDFIFDWVVRLLNAIHHKFLRRGERQSCASFGGISQC